jgi:hypothetical protein
MSKKSTKTGEERLAHARTDLKRMKEEIAPFIKERDRRQYSTAGQWRATRPVSAQRVERRKQSSPPN